MKNLYLGFLGLGILFIILGVSRLFEKNYLSGFLFLLAGLLELLASYSYGKKKRRRN